MSLMSNEIQVAALGDLPRLSHAGLDRFCLGSDLDFSWSLLRFGRVNSHAG